MKIIIPDHIDLTTGDFFVYRTVCVPTGQFYIGKSHVKRRATYFGSGPEITKLKDKYGMESLVKEIIVNSHDENLILDLEAAIIAELIDDPLCVNKASGHSGMSTGYLSGENHPYYGKPGPMAGRKHSEKSKAQMRESASRLIWINNGKECTRINKSVPIPDGYKRGRILKGHKHSEETKRKISESHKGKVVSEESNVKRSVAMTGRTWVNNGVENRIIHIKPGEAIPDGWVRGQLRRRKEND